MNQKRCALILFALSALLCPAHALDYPNVKNNPSIDARIEEQITPHLLPLEHPMRPVLDSIFLQSRAIESESALVEAGFSVIAGPMPRSFVIVARHPAVPGYVFKLYLDSEERTRPDTPHWLSLVRRCNGARGIRKIIRREKIRHFAVPDKWLYVLPTYPFSKSAHPEPVILMETDMELQSYEVTKEMWRTIVTRKHLDELYAILKEGYGGRGTVCLSINVPYTKHGKFAFTDTESLREDLTLKNVKKYLSKDMQRYWDSLIKK